MKKHLLSFILTVAGFGVAHAAEPVLGIVCTYGQNEEAFYPLTDKPSVEYVTKGGVMNAVVMVGGTEKLAVALTDGAKLVVSYDRRVLHDHSFATTAWSSNENGHWHACTADGCDITDYSSLTGDEATAAAYAVHGYGTVATETSYYTCSGCQYEDATRKATYDNAVKAADVVTKINAIGTVEYTAACKTLIDAARTAYDGLTADQKTFVTADQLKVLTDAEKAYADLEAADDVVTKINAIGTVAYTEASKALIDEARSAYNALTDDQKALITAAQLKVLTDAEAAYADLKAADAVVTKINAIGTVEYTTACKTRIDAARSAYDALTDAQKKIVTAAQLKVLTDDEAAYAALVKINAIGTVEYTTDCKNLIDAARNTYDALTDDQKGLIPAAQLQILTDDEAAYAALVKINAIGTVKYTTECKNLIDAARNTYDALTDDQKGLIPAAQLQILTDDEAAYAALVKINAIGTVEYTTECKNLIDAARNAYDALTTDQKPLIPAAQLQILTDDEAAYAALVKINAIGTVEYTTVCKDLIDAARNTYDALTENQKTLVAAAQYKILTDAEKAYADLEAAAAVVENIYAIGEVVYTDECKALIDDARAAYDALTDDQKAIITAEQYKVLTDAEFIYTSFLKPVFLLDVNNDGVGVNFIGRFTVFASEYLIDMGAFTVEPVKGTWHMHGAETDENDVEISSYIVAMNNFTFNYADYKLTDGEWDITLPMGFFVYLDDDYDFEETDREVEVVNKEDDARARFGNSVRRAALNSENLRQVEEITLSVTVKNGVVTSVNSISSSDADTQVYDLAGRKLNSRNAKGIVIVGGKKAMVK